MNMADNIEVYSGPFCFFCTRAKRLLTERKLDFTEYDVHADPGRGGCRLVGRCPAIR